MRTAFCLASALLLVAGCQNGTRNPEPTSSPAVPAAPVASAPGEGKVADGGIFSPVGCGDSDWVATAVHDASGLPEVSIRHPPSWEVRAVAPARVQLMAAGQSFQLLVSAFRGQTMTEDQIRELDEQTMGKFPAVSPLGRLEGTGAFRVYAVTRRTPGSDITLRYYAGGHGLVVVSIETLAPLTATIQAECDRVLQCLTLKFPE